MCVEKISIILVDDHELFRIGLKSTIKMVDNDYEFCVIGEASSGKEFFDILESGIKPDIVLLDIILPDINGIEIAKTLRNTYPEIKIIMLSAEVSEDIISELININVNGYLSKTSQTNEIKSALIAVASGEHFYGQSIAKIIYDVYINRKYEKDNDKLELSKKQELTSRELQIIKLWCDGKTTKEMANELDISHRTIESHKANILKKLEFNKFTDLIKFAIKKRIITL